MPVSLPPVRPDPGCSPFTTHGCRLVPEYFANSRATVELLHPVVEKPDGRQKMFWSLMRSRLKRTVVTLAFAITVYLSRLWPNRRRHSAESIFTYFRSGWPRLTFIIW